MTSKISIRSQRRDKSQTNAAGVDLASKTLRRGKTAVANSFTKHWKKLRIHSENGRFISVSSTLQKDTERGMVSSALCCKARDPTSLKAETNPSIRGRFRTANIEREWENDVRVFQWKLSSRERNLGRVLWR